MFDSLSLLVGICFVLTMNFLQLIIFHIPNLVNKLQIYWFNMKIFMKTSILILLLSIYRLPKIKEYVDKNDPGAMVIPFSGAFEAKLMEMDVEEAKAYKEETKCVG